MQGALTRFDRHAGAGARRKREGHLFGNVAGAEVGGGVAAVAVAEPAAALGGSKLGLRHQPAAFG